MADEFLNENEKLSQIGDWLKENGLAIIAFFVVSLGTIWGWNFHKDYQHRHALEARELYLQLVQDPQNTNFFETIKEEYGNSIYVLQSRLLLAKNSVMTENYDEAIRHLKIVARSKFDFLGDIANLRLAQIYIQKEQTTDALDVLDNTRVKTFTTLFDIAKANTQLRLGNVEASKALFENALQTLPPGSDLRNFITLQIQDLQ